MREVGGLGVELARAVAEGVLDGPAVYAAGGILSTTGGHGDLHSYPLSWIEDYAALAGTMCLADISVLAKPAHVTAVWTAGRQVKGAASE